MKYKITHTTTYEYADPVVVCQSEVHLTPRAAPRQTCTYHRLHVRPTTRWTGKWVDYFGNPVDFFSIPESHRKLTITSISKVELAASPEIVPSATPAWETLRDSMAADRSDDVLDAYQYAFDSLHCRRSAEFADYARTSFAKARPIVEAIVDFTQRVHKDFQFDPLATTVSTPVQEVFQDRRGVCQDLAHLQISCLRSLGLAARYVSGYIRTYPPEGKPRLVGTDASHAWLSVYCGELGWIDTDPTNNLLPRLEHITVAWGRDYNDVCPVSGMYVGGGNHNMRVSVDVAPID